MKHSIFTLLVIVFASLLFAACQSKEERAISKIQDLAEQIQKNGESWTEEEWNDIMEDYSKIQDDLSEGDYHFTDEQLEELGKAQGEFVGACMEQGGKAVGKAINDAFKAGSSFLKGLTGE